MSERATLCTAAAAALLFAVPARADKEAISLDYFVGAGCPDRKQFLLRVHTFTSKAEIVSEDGTARRKFGVQVRRSGSRVQGQLTIDDRGAQTTRQVSGSTCDEVISALALATAIAVDPDALGGATPEPDEAKPSEPAPAPPKPVPTSPPREPVRRAPRATAPAITPVRSRLLYLSAAGRVGNAIAPFPKFEATAALGCTYFAPLEFQIGAGYGPAQHNDQIRVSEWLAWVGVDYRVFDLEPVSVLALAAVEAGQVQASGLGIADGRTLRRPWVAVDVGLGWRVEGPGSFFFQANTGARAPVLLQRYVVTENKGQVPLYQVAQLGYLLGLSVGMHFL